MSGDLKKIVSGPILEDLNKFQNFYKDSLNSEINLINTLIGYISRKKGKQLRPQLCLLSANMCGDPNDNTYRSAALIEMIHVATLIHDDVVDEADIRRGWPSVNRIWKNKLSILVGDFMFSKALSNMIKLKDFDALEILSTTSERLSQGEIQQIEKAIKKDMTEDIYYEMVSDKTASLFSASCKLGAISTTDNIDKRKAMSIFGEKFGLVFQIKDDLLDITGNIEGLGKPAGFDLKKNMLTLPLIYLFENLNRSEAKTLKRKIGKHVKRSELKEVKRLIEKNGGIEYAEKQIDRLSKDAISELDIFPDSKYKSALLDALNFNISRTR